MTTTRIPLVAILLAVLLTAALSCRKPSSTDGSSATSGDGESRSNGDADTEMSGDAAGRESNNSAATRPAELTPCTIVSKEELKGITGIDFTEANSQGNIKVLANCEWSSADAKHSLGIAILPRNGQSRIASDRQYPNAETVEGVADEAVWVPVPGSLTVRQGKAAVSIRLSDSIGDGPTRLKYAKKIAQLVLERM